MGDGTRINTTYTIKPGNSGRFYMNLTPRKKCSVPQGTIIIIQHEEYYNAILNAEIETFFKLPCDDSELEFTFYCQEDLDSLKKAILSECCDVPAPSPSRQQNPRRQRDNVNVSGRKGLF